MKKIIIIIAAILALSDFATAQKYYNKVKLTTTEDSVSYSIGFLMAKNFVVQGWDFIKTDALAKAFSDVLNNKTLAIEEDKLKDTLDNIGIKPALVITDSQVFEKVNKDTPDDIPLTSFSILMARYKGFLDMAVNGAKKLSDLRDGDKILICEGCTHHRQCEDIGTVKLPNWIKKYSGKDVRFEFTSGHGFPEKLSGYDLMIHCGGCMLNEREIRFRMQCAKDQGVPVTNYGTAIAYLKGILDRSISIIYKNK